MSKTAQSCSPAESIKNVCTFQRLTFRTKKKSRGIDFYLKLKYAVFPFQYCTVEFSEFKKNHSRGLSGVIPVSKHDCAEVNSYISLRRAFGRMRKYKHSVSLVSFADSSAVLL